MAEVVAFMSKDVAYRNMKKFGEIVYIFHYLHPLQTVIFKGSAT